MRIGIDGISFAFELAGVGRYLNSLLEEMAQIATEDEFLIYSPTPISLPINKGNWGIRVVDNWLSPRPSLWVQLTLPEVLAKDRVDIFWGQPTNLPLRLRHHCIRVLTLHDLVPYVCPQSMQFCALIRTRLLLPFILKAVEIVVCVSESTAELTTRYFKINRGKLQVVKEAAAPFFKPLDKETAKKIVLGKFGIDRDYIIFVSTIEPRKDHRTLLKALASLPQAPLLVLVGGVGWRCRGILKEISQYEKRGMVRYLGRVEDEYLVPLYSGARLLVYPSRYEGFGLPILEAMACGCPVLCSDSSSLPEVGGAAAQYFRTGDFQDLSLRLKELLSDEQRLKEMSSAGIEHAKLFSFRKSAEEMIRIFHSASRFQKGS